MPLSKAEIDRVEAWFAAKGLHLCFCDRGADEPAELATDLFVIAAAEGTNTLPVVAVTCPHCGVISLYNGKVLRLAE